MTATIIESDTETLEFLDFEHAIPCESVNGCDNVAEWKMVTGCCGKLWLLCTPDIEVLKNCKTNYPNHEVNCVGCRKDVPFSKIVFLIERL